MWERQQSWTKAETSFNDTNRSEFMTCGIIRQRINYKQWKKPAQNGLDASTAMALNELPALLLYSRLAALSSKSISDRKNLSDALRRAFSSVAGQRSLIALKIISSGAKLSAFTTEQINATCLNVQARHRATSAPHRGVRSAEPVAQIHS